MCLPLHITIQLHLIIWSYKVSLGRPEFIEIIYTAKIFGCINYLLINSSHVFSVIFLFAESLWIQYCIQLSIYKSKTGIWWTWSIYSKHQPQSPLDWAPTLEEQQPGVGQQPTHWTPTSIRTECFPVQFGHSQNTPCPALVPVQGFPTLWRLVPKANGDSNNRVRAVSKPPTGTMPVCRMSDNMHEPLDW